MNEKQPALAKHWVRIENGDPQDIESFSVDYYTFEDTQEFEEYKAKLRKEGRQFLEGGQ